MCQQHDAISLNYRVLQFPELIALRSLVTIKISSAVVSFHFPFTLAERKRDLMLYREPSHTSMGWDLLNLTLTSARVYAFWLQELDNPVQQSPPKNKAKRRGSLDVHIYKLFGLLAFCRTRTYCSQLIAYDARRLIWPLTNYDTMFL